MLFGQRRCQQRLVELSTTASLPVPVSHSPDAPSTPTLSMLYLISLDSLSSLSVESAMILLSLLIINWLQQLYSQRVDSSRQLLPLVSRDHRCYWVFVITFVNRYSFQMLVITVMWNNYLLFQSYDSYIRLVKSELSSSPKIPQRFEHDKSSSPVAASSTTPTRKIARSSSILSKAPSSDSSGSELTVVHDSYSMQYCHITIWRNLFLSALKFIVCV